jgi:hypothetical protein
MINIRYRDPNELSPGLHAAAERHGRTTTVYLLSGLNVAQRRAVLRRLRISARRGYGPRLPAPQLALALLADRIRTTLGRAGAVFRLHPAGSTVPLMMASAGAIAFLALSAVSIQVIHRPQNLGPPSFPAAAGAGPVSLGSRGWPGPVAARQARPGARAGGQRGGQQGPAASPGSGSSPGQDAPAGPAVSRSRSDRDRGTGSGTGTGSGGTTLAGGAASTSTPTPTPTPTPTRTTNSAPASSSAPPAGEPSSKPSAPPASGQGNLCLNLGPLGICL